MLQHKYETLNHKLKKKRRISQNNFVIVKNTHEPLIDEKDFYLVEKLLKRNCNHTRIGKNPHLLSGLIICGLCGSKFTFSKYAVGNRKGESYACCSAYKRYRLCIHNAICEKDLHELVRNDILSNKKIEFFSKLEDLSKSTIFDILEAVIIRKNKQIEIQYKLN